MEDKVNIVPFTVVIDYMISKALHIVAHTGMVMNLMMAYFSIPFKGVTVNSTNKTTAQFVFFYFILHIICMHDAFAYQTEYYTLSDLSSENLSTKMATTMFKPRVVTIMKNDKSKMVRNQYIVKSASIWFTYTSDMP